MGFISNVTGVISDSISSELNDQYLETFRTDSLGQELLVKRAHRMNSKGFNQGSSEIITAGSKVLVPESTYALMVDNGKIVDYTAEAVSPDYCVAYAISDTPFGPFQLKGKILFICLPLNHIYNVI